MARIAPLPHDDPRLTTPLFLIREAAAYLRVPPSTFSTWIHGYERPVAGGRSTVGQPIVTSIDTRPGTASIPFVGFAEAVALAAFRQAGVPLQRIRPALLRLNSELGLEHALASDCLYTDGAELLYDYGRERGDQELKDLVVVRNQQRVFIPGVERYLKHITYGPDHWAARIQLPGYDRARVIVDPKRGFGRPMVEHRGIPIDEIIDRWWAGESIRSLSDDFELDETQVEDVIRAATRSSAAA